MVLISPLIAAMSGSPNAVDIPLRDSGTALASAIGTDTLLVACIVLGVVAAIAVGSVLVARKQTRSAARTARARAASMQDLLRMVRMAESIAGIGVWQYDPVTGVQHWSDGLKRLFGMEPGEDFVAGDAETLLYANDIDLIGNVNANAHQRDPYTLHFEIFGYDGLPRTITVEACNLMGKDSRVVRVVAVIRDITSQKERERELESSRAAAVNEAARALELAGTDPLTGLANRRRIMAELDKLVVSAHSQDAPLMLVMFDIDHFKSVNDTFGHLEGDKVLQRVAHIASTQARESDLVGRVGGEEFVWIVPFTDENTARIMTERLRQSIAKGSAAGTVPPVTISAGYTALQPGDTALSLFARADGALYDAKDAGRNRVRMAA